MAELNQRLQNLGMNDSVHADAAPSSGTSNHSSGSGEKRAYIPPHMRHAMRASPVAAPGPVPGPPPSVQNGTSNGVQASRWSSEYVHNFFSFFRLCLPLFRVVFLSHLEIILVMRQTYQFCHVTIDLQKRF